MRVLFFLLFSVCFVLAEKPASKATLISEVTHIAAGKPFTVALQLAHPEQWHSYYKNSGGIEFSPSIEWKLPEGARAGEIQWPAPKVKEGFFGKSFIYEGSPIFLIEITPPTSLTAGETFPLQVLAKWQICKTSCLDEEAEFTLDLPVADQEMIAADQTRFFQEARKKIPSSLAQNSLIQAFTSKEKANTFFVQFPPMEHLPQDFIPNEPFIKSLSEGGSVTQNEKGILLQLERKQKDALDSPIPLGKSISGILLGKSNYQIPLTPLSTAPAESISFAKLFNVLWQMFIGGLILNLMPCVFPVIGLKIMGFVQQAGENRRSIALHGLSFSLGVFASFTLLSGLLFVIRSAALKNGSELVGWGYQLQNPWVVVSLLLLMFIMALNMFGIFEIGTSATSIGGNLQNKSGHSGSFFSGILATVVATPCSAPFLGVAIGTAIALPAIQFFPAFAAMALGLSTPYLVLSFFPHLVSKLPRPGAWMESFKQGMSFLLFATAAYLLWVYAGMRGQENLLPILFGLTSIALAAWIYGRWNLPFKSRSVRSISLLLTAIFAISGAYLIMPKPAEKVWEVWSEEKVEELLEKGAPVFIDFTAQWCLTCQVNKKVAYSDEVLRLAKEKGIVFLKADKTSANPAIEEKLAELGRTAIPVNVLLIPDQEPIIAPEILTPSILIELFKKVP